MIMKKIFLVFLVCLSFSFGNDFCIFDANGNCVSVLQDIREAQNVLKEKGFKKYYVASKEKSIVGKYSYKSVIPTKSNGHKKWYEVDWNQGVKLCPEETLETEKGIWIVNSSAHVDSLNCLYVDGSPYTRSILVLYAKNENDLKNADSSWLLVNQAIVNLKGKKFTVYGGRGRSDAWKLRDTSYTVQLNYDLIVDKTELRVRDALWLREGENFDKIRSVLHLYKKYYPSSDSLDVLDYPSPFFMDYLTFRSKRDGLESMWNWPKINESAFNKSANGYRVPYYDEWYILQNAGQSKIFSWGDQFVEDSLKKYADIHCAEKKSGIYPVKQYAPNQFGLYDTYGNAEDEYLILSDENILTRSCSALSNNPGKACRDLLKYKCLRRNEMVFSGTFKTPGFPGMRMVRILE